MPAKDIELHGSLWMTVGGENFGGSNRIALLAKIAEHGSITRAAKALGISYKAAWDAIDAINNMAGEPLVERVTGGKGGGGTQLTRRGAQLVENFVLIEQEHRRFVAQLSRQADGIADDALLIRRMAMKTSARNQFLGRVVGVRQGTVNDEITLDLPGGQQLVATVTRESTEQLELRPGAEAFALVKASAIVVMVDGQAAKFSARNRLVGTIERLQIGAVNTEVVIALPGGGSVAAIITNDSSETLELTEGKTATALFKASSIILGTSA